MSDVLRKRLMLIDAAAFGILVSAVAATAFFGVLPLWRQQHAAEKEKAKIHAELAKLDNLSRSLTEVEADLQHTQTRLTDAEAKLPRNGAMDLFMAQLAKVAEDAGLQVNSVTPRPLQDSQNYRVMPVQISGTGSFETCYRFLTGLRNIDRITRLDDLVLQLESDSPDANPNQPRSKPVCKIVVAISTFVAR